MSSGMTSFGISLRRKESERKKDEREEGKEEGNSESKSSECVLLLCEVET